MLNTELRVSEAVSLRWKDLNLTSGKLTVREGKGAKDRTLWVDNSQLKALSEWKERQVKKLMNCLDGCSLRYDVNYCWKWPNNYCWKSGDQEGYLPPYLKAHFRNGPVPGDGEDKVGPKGSWPCWPLYNYDLYTYSGRGAWGGNEVISGVRRVGFYTLNGQQKAEVIVKQRVENDRSVLC